MYEMTTISNGTRIRSDHNTGAGVLGDIPANVKVTGEELFVATMQLSNSGGVYQFVGDKWLKVTHNNITGWVAYIHKGQAICKDFKQVESPDPDQTPTFPTSFELVDPNGNKALYQFVRVIE